MTNKYTIYIYIYIHIHAHICTHARTSQFTYESDIEVEHDILLGLESNRKDKTPSMILSFDPFVGVSDYALILK